MPVLRVFVAQFYNGIGAHGTRPYHWQICIETGYDRGLPVATAFYIRGSPAAGFVVSVTESLRYTTASLYRGAVYVGSIHQESYTKAAECIMSAELYQRECFDSQDWTEAALRKLYAQDFIRRLWSKERLKEELRGAEAAWERGDA
ncbi:hypothetical protein BD414DRAFT_488855 [Trametes punicea]|nr:hypothetical protein BD414DRAFT_488855 [Trametes punicea]